MNRAVLVELRREYPHDMADLVTASDFFDIRPSVQKEFRRPITVKLPLPPLDEEEVRRSFQFLFFYFVLLLNYTHLYT